MRLIILIFIVKYFKVRLLDNRDLKSFAGYLEVVDYCASVPCETTSIICGTASPFPLLVTNILY